MADENSSVPRGFCQCGCGERTNIAHQTDNRSGWKKGEPLRYLLGHSTKGVERPLGERFWEKVDRRGPSECWEWTAFRRPLGYGQFRSRGGRKVIAARVAWELTHGPIPDGLIVCHRCDNPPCCNPAHLFLGTHQDNMRDMRAKGRSARGERSGVAKLSDDFVNDVRARHAAGASQASISRALNIPYSTVNAVVHRRTWRHV